MVQNEIIVLINYSGIRYFKDEKLSIDTCKQVIDLIFLWFSLSLDVGLRQSETTKRGEKNLIQQELSEGPKVRNRKRKLIDDFKKRKNLFETIRKEREREFYSVAEK